MSTGATVVLAISGAVLSIPVFSFLGWCWEVLTTKVTAEDEKFFRELGRNDDEDDQT